VLAPPVRTLLQRLKRLLGREADGPDDARAALQQSAEIIAYKTLLQFSDPRRADHTQYFVRSPQIGAKHLLDGAIEAALEIP
jgi:hypothetical protein